MNPLADKLIELLGGPLYASRRAKLATWIALGLVVLLGCTGLWGGRIVALTTIIAVAAHVVTLRAEEVLRGKPAGTEPGDGSR